MAPSCRCAGHGRGTVLGIAVDLSVLPYLLRLIPWPSPSGRPLSVGPSRSRPCPVVSFLAFHERGLRYSLHWFLRGLLNKWGLELQHLNPTRVLHIAGFVTVCEAFLGMEPHVDLFQ